MKRYLLRASVLALLLVSPRASAQDASGAAAAFANGKKLFAGKNYVGAIAEFERAYRLRPHHAVQCSIAVCYENLNRFVEAAEHYRRCLKEGADATEKAERIRSSLKTAESRITWIDVLSPGEGGTIHLDGQPVGLAPRRIPVNPGTHLVEVRRAGARAAKETLTTIGGEQKTLTLVPEKRAEVPPPPPPPKTMAVVPPEPPPPPPPPPPRRKLSPAWFWTSVGLTVALGGATAALGALTLKQRSDYEASPTKDGYDSFVSRRMLTNVFAGLTAAAAATGTVLFFFTEFRRSPASERTDTALGLGLRGSF